MHEMKDTGIVWCPYIPVNWEMDRIKNYFEIAKDTSAVSNPTVLKLARSGIQVKDVTTNEGQMAESYENYNKVQPGDLLLNPMDLYSGANCNVSEVEGVISPAYTNLRAKRKLNPKFFDYYFKIQYWTMALFAHGKGVSFDNRWTINAETIKNYEIPIPSYSKQNEIVKVIEEKCVQIDALIANQEAQIEKLKQYKISLITELITQKNDSGIKKKPSGFEYIGDIPTSWQIKKAKMITKRIVVGVVIKPADYFDPDGTVPFLRGMNVKEFCCDPDLNDLVFISQKSNDLLSKSVVHAGDILIVRDGSIGVSCVVPKRFDGANVVSMIIMTVDEDNDPNFICYLLNSFIGKHQFELTKIGSALTHTSVGTVSNLQMLIPPLDEQIEIVKKLDEATEKVDRLMEIKIRKIAELNKYKKSLIYEYVTGKKEVIL